MHQNQWLAAIEELEAERYARTAVDPRLHGTAKVPTPTTA